jgi:hypothetical protein
MFTFQRGLNGVFGAECEILFKYMNDRGPGAIGRGRIECTYVRDARTLLTSLKW